MKRSTGFLIIAGLLTGGLGLHVTVTRPLTDQIGSLTLVVSRLQRQVRDVADYRDDVAGTNDLLGELKNQSLRTGETRAALENIRRLDREIRGVSASARDAMAGMSQITRLQSEVIAQSRRISAMEATLELLADYHDRVAALAEQARLASIDLDIAEDSLRDLGSFQQRVSLEASHLDVAQNRFTRLIEVKQMLESIDPADIAIAESRFIDMECLTQQIAANEAPTEQARQIADQFIALQDDLISRGNRVDVARTHADQLLGLEEALANDAGRDIALANSTLNGLLRIGERLASQDQRIAAAIESFELMQSFQDEFLVRMQQLENVRRGLTDLIMMEGTVARILRVLQPLMQLTDLERMDSEQLQSIARSMMNEQPGRIAAGPPAPPVRIADRPDETPIEEALVPLPPIQ
jgi:hypothetical protein